MSAAVGGSVAVLGAGIVGVSVALELARRGRRVTLVDRREPGEETSYGNAGIIAGGNYVPIAFPRDPRELAKYALKRTTGLDFHWRFLPTIAPWLFRLAQNSTPAAIRANGDAVNTLLAHALAQHKARLAEGGRLDLLREAGWLHIHRTERSFADAAAERQFADERGFPYESLSPGEVSELEPHLRPAFARATLWPGDASASDPGEVTRNAFSLFVAAGGAFRRAAVRAASRTGAGWSVALDDGELVADEVVVALGPWSMDVLRPLGISLPFAVKRGYHQHYRALGNAGLSRPVLDLDEGYVLAPMTRGVRLTTGIEFGDRDAPPTPVQLAKARTRADDIFPLGEPVEDEPWLGRRPCLPDSRPIIGPAPGQEGLWLCFGHAHLGFTLGPVSGALLAQLMAGEPPLADPAAFAADRFGRVTAP